MGGQPHVTPGQAGSYLLVVQVRPRMRRATEAAANVLQQMSGFKLCSVQRLDFALLQTLLVRAQ